MVAMRQFCFSNGNNVCVTNGKQKQANLGEIGKGGNNAIYHDGNNLTNGKKKEANLGEIGKQCKTMMRATMYV